MGPYNGLFYDMGPIRAEMMGMTTLLATWHNSCIQLAQKNSCLEDCPQLGFNGCVVDSAKTIEGRPSSFPGRDYSILFPSNKVSQSKKNPLEFHRLKEHMFL